MTEEKPKLKLIYWPNKMLTQVSSDVTEPVDQAVLEEMHQVMKSAGGIGLSGIQVGILKKIIVLRNLGGPSVFINTKLKLLGKKVPMLEGCLSIPGFFEQVYRHTEVEAEWQDQWTLAPQKANFTGILAHALQHEVEHAEGKMFVEYLPASERSRILGTMLKLRKMGKLR